MKNSKGVTMASLVILITVIVLISSMAMGFGYRYITQTRKTDVNAFQEVLSVAITKREGNNSVSQKEYPRLGYSIKTVEAFKDIVKKFVPELGPKAEMLYERGLWYIVDSVTASQLGVRNASDYIDVLDVENGKDMKFALVDYLSGTVILFDANSDGLETIKDGLESSQIEPADGHVHDYNIPEATCTEDKKCVICGYVVEVAKGHKYDGEMPATAIDDEFHSKKVCSVCGMGGGYERHTNLDKFAFYKSGDGTWYHYNGCSVCGWPNLDDKSNYQKCTTFFESVSETQHQLKCRICEHAELSNHNFKYNYLNETYHEQVCQDCGFVNIKFEQHEDTTGDEVCDKCGQEIITSEYPVIRSVTISNKEYPNSKYVTKGETVKLVFTADKAINDALVSICGYGDGYLSYEYSADRRTCTVEMLVKDNMTIPQNTEVTFSVNCKSMTTGKWMVDPITKTSDGSKLIYDSLPLMGEYIPKETY